MKISIEIPKTSLTLPKRKPDIISVLALCFLLPSTLVSWMAVYEAPGIAYALTGGALGAALMICYFWFLPLKTGLRLLIISAISFVALLIIFLRSLMQGALYAWQFIIASYSKVFPQRYYPLPFPSDDGRAGFFVFLVFFAFLLSVAITYAVVRLRSFYAAVLLTAPFLWLSYVRHGMPPVLPSVAIFAAWAALLLKGSWVKQKRKSSILASGAAMLLFGVFMALMLFIPPQGTAYKDFAQAIHTSIDEAMQNYAVRDFFSWLSGGSGRLGARTRPQVDLRRAGNVELNDDVVMRVRGNIQPGQYLRGFSAGDYTGTNWLPATDLNYIYPWDNNLLYSGIAHIKFLPTFEYDWQNSPSEGMFTLGEWQQNIGGNHPTAQGEIEFDYESGLPYSHMPYYATAVNPNRPVFTQDAFLQSFGANSEEVYSVNYSMHKTISANISTPLASSVAMMRYYDTLSSDHLTFDAQILMAHYTNTETFNQPTNSLPEEVAAAQNEWFTTLYGLYEQDELLNDLNEPEYRRYIESVYTQLPDNLAQTLLSIAGENGIVPAQNYAQWHFTAWQVKTFLQNFGEYTLKPGPMPQGSDFVDYFLTQSKRGYCVHYASAATAMLRALGVPARYVEGLVTDVQTPLNTRNWLPVTNENAHAWVEIWEPGIGWTPVEVTRGGADSWQEESAAPTIGSGPAAYNPTIPDIGGTGGVQGPLDTQRTLSETAKTIITVFTVLASVVILVTLPLVPCNLRKRKFTSPNRNKAALAIYRYIVKLKRFKVNPSNTATHIAEKAKFSSHTVSDYEFEVLKAEANVSRYLAGLELHNRIFMFATGLWIHA